METTTNRIGFKYSGIDNKVTAKEEDKVAVSENNEELMIGLPISVAVSEEKMKIENLTQFLISNNFSKLDINTKTKYVLEFRKSVALISESDYKDSLMLAIVRGG